MPDGPHRLRTPVQVPANEPCAPEFALGAQTGEAWRIGGCFVRVLHVVADLDRRKGGATTACLGLATTMSKRGHTVRIVTTDRGFSEGEHERTRGVAIEALPGSWPAFFGTSWPLYRRLREAIAEVDVVHLHSLYLFHDWAASRLCRRFDKPYIVEPHGTLDPYIYRRHRWRKAAIEVMFQNAALERAAGLHYTAREEWELARPHARTARGSIIPIGIDLAAYEHLPPREALNERYPMINRRKVILFLGRLSFKKGLDVAVSAFADVARDRDDLFLIIAGPDDGVRSGIERRIKALGMADRSLFTGMVQGTEKNMILAGSSVFLLPSQSENFGITVVEAAACGIPVVISDRVNVSPDFKDAEAGLVAAPNAEAFARHLRFLLENPLRAEEIGRRGAALVHQRFTWDALSDLYEEMYVTAVQKKALPELS